MINSVDVGSLRAVLDAMPAMLMVVDDDVRILDCNQAAAAVLDGGPETFRLKRSGDAMHCLHSLETPAGCGHSVHCQRCVVRTSVQEARHGTHVARRRARMELKTTDGIREIFALVTATPITYDGQPRVLLVIDNISDLTDIQSFLPICSVCKKIRPEKDRWLPLESYFKNYWDVDFSHSYCPSCQTAEQARLLQEFAEVGGGSTQ
ncbi:MAG: PAS domain-containing protein [Candidatus Delongbacteria bacterium]